jgi:hypothetical protein
MYYYYTDGENGPLISKGFSTEPMTEGVDASGWYLRHGEPPANYTTKASEFDIWNTTTLQWEANPDQAALEAAQTAAIMQRELQQQTAEVLKERKAKLVASDWTQLPNSPLSAEAQAAWATYRQELRDITAQSGYPTEIIWPTPPQ